jgi:hypothetical protein
MSTKPTWIHRENNSIDHQTIASNANKRPTTTRDTAGILIGCDLSALCVIWRIEPLKEDAPARQMKTSRALEACIGMFFVFIPFFLLKIAGMRPFAFCPKISLCFVFNEKRIALFV